jgi:secreted PhoX family phosphatase
MDKCVIFVLRFIILNMQRRNFIEFLGKGAIATSLLPPHISLLNLENSRRPHEITKRVKGIYPTDKDDLVLADGLNYDILVEYGDKISKRDSFGYDNDYNAFLPGATPDEGILWTNHESVNPLFVYRPGHSPGSKSDIDWQMYNVGGSFVKLDRSKGKWKVVKNDPANRRITAQTRIPFNWPEKIAGSRQAMGTLGNCAGGVTPWGTVLTCEENYQYYYGERNRRNGNRFFPGAKFDWDHHYNNPPEHYGWVVEVNPQDGSAQKHVALGRCAHECATVVELEDKRVVVYMGDDKTDECVYKFVGDKPGSLDSGTLYVANTLMGKWIAIDHDIQPTLQALFKDQTEVLIFLREAARYLGATPLGRPEDIEIDPVSGDVLVTLTNNVPRKDYYGQIMKIQEKDGRYDGTEFVADTYLTGGQETGFACPDNLAFDRGGNLWFTSDISGSAMNKPPYDSFKNNGLFIVPRTGPSAGKVVQLASAPVEAEFTGPFFSPDGKTLFLSVQHPGERSSSGGNYTSHWPNGRSGKPNCAVVTIEGPLLEELQGTV